MMTNANELERKSKAECFGFTIYPLAIDVPHMTTYKYAPINSYTNIYKYATNSVPKLLTRELERDLTNI